MQCRGSRSTLMGGKTIIRNYNEKNLFFTKFFIRKNFFEEHDSSNNLESILGGMSEKASASSSTPISPLSIQSQVSRA